MDYDRPLLAAVTARLTDARWSVIERGALATPDVSCPAVVIDLDPMLVSSARIARTAHQGSGSVQVTCIGESRAQALDLHAKVRGMLLGWTPAVPGSVCDPLVMDSRPRSLDPYTALPDRTLYEVATRWTARLQAA